MPFEEAEAVAISMAQSFGMSSEAIRELVERKRKEHQSRMAGEGSEAGKREVAQEVK